MRIVLCTGSRTDLIRSEKAYHEMNMLHSASTRMMTARKNSERLPYKSVTARRALRCCLRLQADLDAMRSTLSPYVEYFERDLTAATTEILATTMDATYNVRYWNLDRCARVDVDVQYWQSTQYICASSRCCMCDCVFSLLSSRSSPIHDDSCCFAADQHHSLMM